MLWLKLFIEDITFEHIEFCDKYIKKVITNMRRSYYRSANRRCKGDILYIDFDSVSEEVGSEDAAYETVAATCFMVGNVSVPVSDFDMAKALKELPEKQRLVLLRNVVLEESLTDIAKDMNVSVTMVAKYRNKALDYIRKRLKTDEAKKKADSATGRYYP